MEKGKRNFGKKGKKGKMNWAQRRKMAKENQEKSRNTNYQITQYKMQNIKFDLYYRRQLDPILDSGDATTPEMIKENKDKDFKAFVEQLRVKLPITFRVNPLNVGFETLTELFCSDTFVQDWCEKNKSNPDLKPKEGRIDSLTEDELANLKFKCIEFYPEKLLYQIPLTREILRKDSVLTSIHKFIQQSNDSGLLTRQEIVSMIPPLLLGVKPKHKIFDACAAPGSKTAQLLEFSLRGLTGKDLTLNPGFVIANDADDSRANMLAHQMSRFNYGCIVNHDAQNFPTINYQPGTEAYSSIDLLNFDSRAHFDRIICDVPCSSDAAIRKIPKKWDTWDTNDGASLHPLQLKILLRSLMMLNPYTDDAYLTYSTCSLNPIENEAVVSAALQKLNSNPDIGEEFELIDCREKLAPFRTRSGIVKWSVFDSLSKHRRKRSQKEREKIEEYKKERAKARETNKNNLDDDQASDNSENVAIGIDSQNNDEISQNAPEDNADEGENQQNEEVKEEAEEGEKKEPVFEEYFREFKTHADVPTERQNRYLATFFPPEGTEEEIEAKYHLSRCVRVFANDQDTSGFFIALFKRKGIRKIIVEKNENQEEIKEDNKAECKIVPIQKPLKNLIRCDPKDPDIEFIATYYGLTQDFPLDQIFTYSPTMNKLMVINRGLSDMLYGDQEKQLSLVAAGAETFIRNTSKTYGGTECIFRISQNGVYHVYPFMTKRIIRIDLDIFLLLLNKKKIEFSDIPESDFKDKVKALTCGCFVVVTQVNEIQEEVIVLHRHFHHVNTMISDLNLHKIMTCLKKEF